MAHARRGLCIVSLAKTTFDTIQIRNNVTIIKGPCIFNKANVTIFLNLWAPHAQSISAPNERRKKAHSKNSSFHLSKAHSILQLCRDDSSCSLFLLRTTEGQQPSLHQFLDFRGYFRVCHVLLSSLRI